MDRQYLTDVLECGDLMLFYPKHAGIGRLITMLTFGPVNHAAIALSGAEIFETDGDFFKAKYTPSAEYDHYHVKIIRLKASREKKQRSRSSALGT